MREVGLDGHGVGLQLGGALEHGHDHGAGLELGVLNEVAEEGAEDEVGNGNRVTGDVLTAMVVELLLTEGHELAESGDHLRDQLVGLRWILVESGASDGAHDVSPAVNNRVAVAGGLPVLRVVVAVADTERAEHGTELSHVDFLATDVSIDLRETSAELRGGALSHFDGNFLVGLTVMREHLLKRVSATVANVEVGVLDSAGKNALLSRTSGTWLRGGRRGVAAHLFSSKIFL